ncbi:unnamed protein product [Linum tenue]|uniref:Uncharacterized protein n=1 Tax=Linum tenue TaxID=586396 RepID=A0AAV0KE71_9ROSI|nr:unnamed protein product [Linum tenue]
MPSSSKSTARKKKNYQDDDDDDGVRLRYYAGSRCKCCLELNSREIKPQPDDDDFITPSDDFGGDEFLKLHVVHYRRKIWETGVYCWDIDCPPRYGGIGGQAYPGKHLYGDDMKTDELLIDMAQHVVDTYNKEKGGRLVLGGVRNVSAEGCNWRNFYITFSCRDGRGARKKTKRRLKTYRAAVSCRIWSFGKEKQILVFRDPSGKDLLPPDPFYGFFTTPFRPRPELAYRKDREEEPRGVVVGNSDDGE